MIHKSSLKGLTRLCLLHLPPFLSDCSHVFLASTSFRQAGSCPLGAFLQKSALIGGPSYPYWTGGGSTVPAFAVGIADVAVALVIEEDCEADDRKQILPRFRKLLYLSGCHALDFFSFYFQLRGSSWSPTSTSFRLPRTLPELNDTEHDRAAHDGSSFEILDDSLDFQGAGQQGDPRTQPRARAPYGTRPNLAHLVEDPPMSSFRQHIEMPQIYEKTKLVFSSPPPRGT
ncbi:hypothetical protein E6O75_ATG10189 [Venturia nashicola]|uniref:Uncharacterized protein n=1 Tax=Venturia nashicola TaxID=86259 RepID=A0A4Z1ND83_9PEZI|nr:hypothetical protein E6O75_ATG10189 [Venturia nashicola]